MFSSRSALAALALAASLPFAAAQTTALTPAQKAAASSVHHEANYDDESKQALALARAHKMLEAMPLCTDLTRQDPTVGIWAECRGAGLFDKAATETDPNARGRDNQEGYQELVRARDLGDTSNYVLSMIDRAQHPTPNSVGYAKSTNPAALAAMQEAENAFSHRDMKAAFAAYVRSSEADPGYYDAKLYAGDACFSTGDLACAGEWFAKAIALDPNRETAYRYWGDALYKAGKPHEAKEKFEQAVVAEPYIRLSWNGLLQWAQQTKTQMDSLAISRPKVDAASGKVNITVSPNGSPAEMTAWLVYAGCRAGDTDKNAPRGAQKVTPPYSPELESKCLFTAADALASTREADLTPQLRNLLALKHDGMIECWVRLNSGDPGSSAGYDVYRNAHRDLLIAYLDKYVVHEGVPAQQRPQLSTDPPK